MSVLTTSQLTFCDLRDSYNIHIDAEYIGLTCDNNGSVIDQTDITIQYYASIGTDRIGASCSISNLPDGVSVSTTQSTKTTNGTIVFSVSKGAKLSDDFTSSAKATFTTSDSEQFTFEKYITFIKSIKGNAAINFQIYSVDGFEFSDSVSSIELKTMAFQGGNAITSGVTYQWKYWNAESEDDDKYQAISDATSSTFTVNISDSYAFSSIKCEMTYDGITYEDYVSLTKKTSVYTSVVKFFDGNNVITNNEDYLIAYVELYKDNTPEELLYCDEVYLSNNNSVNESIITTDKDGSNDEMMYFAYKKIINGATEYDVVLGQYSSGRWRVIKNKYIYHNDLFSNTTSPVVLIPKEKISRSLTINFETYNDDVVVARTSAMVFDFNDPTISSTAPSNPQKGQLWLDTSVSPNVLKMWDGSEWVNSGYQNGNVVYTSQPTNGYSKGDLWILADGETCDTSKIDLNTTYITEFFSVETSTDPGGWSYSDYESGGLKLTPNNFGVNSSTATVTLTALRDLTKVNIGGAYYTETHFDKISLTVAGTTQLNQVSGASDYTSIWTGSLAGGQKIVLKFTKDTSNHADNENSTYFTILCDPIVNEDGYNYGPGSMLKATVTSSVFNKLHWVDADKENTSVIDDIKQYFTFDKNTGLKIGQSNEQFHVNISSTEMGFYDSKQKVVSISNQSATIQSAKLKGNTDFYGQINICDPKSNPEDNNVDTLFVFKVEEDGSFSLALAT